MKKLVTTLLLTAAIAAGVSPAAAKNICLSNYRIDKTTIPDSKHIVFHMQDGSRWSNELRNSCPGLKFHGFVVRVWGDGQICANSQSVSVIDSGEVCLLGNFTQEAPSRHAAKAAS